MVKSLLGSSAAAVLDCVAGGDPSLSNSKLLKVPVDISRLDLCLGIS